MSAIKQTPCESFWHGAPGHECIPAANRTGQPRPEHIVKAEAFREAADEGAGLEHLTNRRKWAAWLRDRADALEGGES